MNYILINGSPINVWPFQRRTHLRDIADVDDVEYEDITEKDLDNEETERDNRGA